MGSWSNPWPVVAAAVLAVGMFLVAVELLSMFVVAALNSDESGGGSDD